MSVPTRTRYWVLKQNARTWTVSTSRGGANEEDLSLHFYADDIVMETVVNSNEIFDPPPWVRHGIETRGWRVVSKEISESGLVYHGQADWRQVADDLAAAVGALTQQEDLEDPAPVEQASRALDNYRIAVTEVELAQQGDGESDGVSG